MVFTPVSIICIAYAAMAVSTYKWAYRKSVSTCRDDRRNDPYSTFFSVMSLRILRISAAMALEIFCRKVMISMARLMELAA